MELREFFHNQLVQIGIVIVVAGPLQIIAKRLIERLVRRMVKADRYETKIDERKREDTIIGMFHTVAVILIWVLAVLSILSILRINLAALITGAGIFGVIFGLGAQNTIKDYLAGIYILAENQYRVGDIVTLSGGTTGQIGTSGVVEEISLRITRLRGQDGTLNIVRNGEASIITNRTFKYANVVVDFTLDYNTDIDIVEKAINKTGKDMLKDEHWNALITEPITFLRIEDMTPVGIVIRTIGKVKPAAQWDVAGEFRRRAKKTFAKNGVAFALLEVPTLQPGLPAGGRKAK